MSVVLDRVGSGIALMMLITTSTATAQSTDYAGWTDAPIPDGRVGEAIRFGQKLVTQPAQFAQSYSGNALNCTSCHLNGGRTANAAPWVGIWGVFPEYRARNAKVNRIEDRIGDCFERSLNGRRPPDDSPEMVGVMAYMQWLSRGVPTGTNVRGRGFLRITSPQPPDPVRGQAIFADKCSICHGAEGQGMTQGDIQFPPLWGPESFNIGAGMARLNTAAAFVKANMPFGQGGSLTDQEAFDVAAFFTTQPRPDFAAKDKDWPRGEKPVDARY
jgi:thiosulfate dehydrogenase